MSLFSENIKYLRKQKGLKQSEILAFGQTTWNNYERGISMPRTDDLVKISNFFGVSVNDLVDKNIRDVHLNTDEAGRKKQQESTPNSTSNSTPKGYTLRETDPLSGIAMESKTHYNAGCKECAAKDKIIDAQATTIASLKSALALAEDRIKDLSKAQKKGPKSPSK